MLASQAGEGGSIPLICCLSLNLLYIQGLFLFIKIHSFTNVYTFMLIMMNYPYLCRNTLRKILELKPQTCYIENRKREARSGLPSNS